MSERWHLVTGEYSPAIGGIARFTHVLARALAAQGASVHVWTPGPAAAERSIEVHSLPDCFGGGSRRVLAPLFDAGHVEPIVLQYTPNLLGRRGANVAFCAWLASRARRGADLRVVFHEPFFYFGLQSPARNGLAVIHRAMAAILLSSARTVYLSSPSWRRLLEPYAFGRRIDWIPVPISIGDPPAPTQPQIDRIRKDAGAAVLVGYLGGYGEEIRDHLRAAVSAVRSASPAAIVLCMGRGGREFAAAFSDPRVCGTGELAEDAITASVAACDLVIAPFEEGITMRRTSVLRSLAAGVPVVTTRGRYTEALWTETGSVALVPAGDAHALADTCARLLSSPGEARALGARGRAVYETRFSPAALIAALTSSQVEHAGAHHPGR
jgi:glycosyltransferase involved in cell wall biosynthesis